MGGSVCSGAGAMPSSHGQGQGGVARSIACQGREPWPVHGECPAFREPRAPFPYPYHQHLRRCGGYAPARRSAPVTSAGRYPSLPSPPPAPPFRPCPRKGATAARPIDAFARDCKSAYRTYKCYTAPCARACGRKAKSGQANELRRPATPYCAPAELHPARHEACQLGGRDHQAAAVAWRAGNGLRGRA